MVIQKGSFVKVIMDVLERDDIFKDECLFVAGSMSVPEHKEDPYTLRTKFLVCKVKNDHVVYGKIYMIDPRTVIPVGEAEQGYLIEILNQDFEKVFKSLNIDLTGTTNATIN